MSRADMALDYRRGRPSDLSRAYELSELAMHDTALRQGVLPPGTPFDEAELRAGWLRERPLFEFIAAQDGARLWLCEQDGELVGYAMVARFGAIEELTDVMVARSHHGIGIGRGLLERCWPEVPSPELGRAVVAAGSTADLTLYTGFGAMPVTGHWHLRQRTEEYLERRSLEIDATEPGVHMLAPDRAVAEWKRLEPPAIGHERPLLHEFFGRTRNCLACVDADSGHADGLCWVSAQGEIGPAVGATAEDLVPVVLAALDRVAKAQEPQSLGIFCTTDSWWVLRRLRQLGFRVWWPSWVLCSLPLPGLDRYLPTRPARLL